MKIKGGILTLLFTTVGCTGGEDSKSSASSMSASSGCVAGRASDDGAVDLNQLAIRGPASAAPGDVARYALNADVGCAGDRSVSWKTLGAPGGADTAVFSASFRRPGSYVVQARVQSASTPVPTEIALTTAVPADQITISGPQVGMAYVESTFVLVVPTGLDVRSARWTFGDQAAAVDALNTVKHAYVDAGTFEVGVRVTLAGGEVRTLTHAIQIIPVREGFECTNSLSLSGATAVGVNVPADLSVYIPPCLVPKVVRLAWSFGDGATAADQSVRHQWASVGRYPVMVGLYLANAATPFVTLSSAVDVTEADPGVDPVDDQNNQCASVGLTRSITGGLYTKEAACGIGGTRLDTYHDLITERCEAPAKYRTWTEVGRAPTLVNQGECKAQACALPSESLDGVDVTTQGFLVKGGVSYLMDGVSKTFYATKRPAGACAEVATTRTCANGVLGGLNDSKYLACQNGCAGVGPSDAALPNQLVGQESVAKTCAFGEAGIFDTFAHLATKTCQNGAVIISEERRGDLLLAGSCPTYHWAETGTFGPCSADCGGTQTQVFSCRDAGGEPAPSERCAGQIPPVVERACDGNPDAVKRVESEVTNEDGGQSKTCPANQIGIIALSRTKTVTSTHACVNHVVQLADETVTYGAWTSQNFCRDYVAYRCSQDSLSNDAAVGRYKWMLKCADRAPVIKDFLTQFAGYRAGTDQQPYLSYKNRKVYATFMDRATSPEKVWKAPTKETASCEIPATVYVAAVCTASCATPEQQILAEAKGARQLAYAPIGTAWQEQFKAVATLTGDRLDGKKVARAEVDQWVTEMLDEEHDILDFRTKSGGVLRVTPNHPLVTAEGTVKLASDFVVGDDLVRLGGVTDPIVSIEPSVHFGKVLNVFVKSSDPRRNIVVTNGFLNGTAFFQNEGSAFVNRYLLRTSLTRGAIK